MTGPHICLAFGIISSLIGCSRETTLDERGYGETWPFIHESLSVRCQHGKTFLTVDNQTWYPLTGGARFAPERVIVSKILGIQKPDAQLLERFKQEGIDIESEDFKSTFISGHPVMPIPTDLRNNATSVCAG